MAVNLVPTHSIKNDDCPICYEKLNRGVKVLSGRCGAQYCKPCLKRWVGQNPSCPSCRDPITHIQGRAIPAVERVIDLVRGPVPIFPEPQEIPNEALASRYYRITRLLSRALITREINAHLIAAHRSDLILQIDYHRVMLCAASVLTFAAVIRRRDPLWARLSYFIPGIVVLSSDLNDVLQIALRYDRG